MTAMDITIHANFLPHERPERRADASTATSWASRSRNDVGDEGMRWITVGPRRQRGDAIVLDRRTCRPRYHRDERRHRIE